MRFALRLIAALPLGWAVSAVAVTGGAWVLARLGVARAEAVVAAAMGGFVVCLLVALRVAQGRDGFRRAMTAVHTWGGLVFGSVLFVVFWMGTLSVFDREIDRWTMPATRLGAPPAEGSLDRTLVPAVAALAAEAGGGSPDLTEWSAFLPSAREPVLRVTLRRADGAREVRHVDPASGALLPAPGTLGGTGFVFPMHFSLHVTWQRLGIWIVGAAGMTMLVLLVSGIAVHRRVFAEFFTFRPERRVPRANLDLHNLTGVVGLPFHFVLVLSGLVIFIGIFYPQAQLATHGAGPSGAAQLQREAFGAFTRPKTGQPADARASLDAMVDRATRAWNGEPPHFVRVVHPGDAAAYVELRRTVARDITMHAHRMTFDAASGDVLAAFEPPPTVAVQRFVSGLHFVQFDHDALRWLYFGGGLSGCVMIATGFVFWIETRRARHVRSGARSVRTVESLTIATVTGVVVATFAWLALDRLLPADATAFGQSRAALEMWGFGLAWLAATAHAVWRAPRAADGPALAAWREQCIAIAVLAVACVALNAVTTGDDPVTAWRAGRTAVAAMDVVMLAGAGIAATVARRLARAGRARARRAVVATPAT